MAIYRLYPEKDTFINSAVTGANAGRDEIVEIASYPRNIIEGISSRVLVQYKTSEIQSSLNSIVGNSFSASLNYYLAEATELPEEVNLEVYPLAESWDNGLGKYHDMPVNTSGCSWTYRTKNNSNAWRTSGFSTNVTASYSGSSFGGGSWYTASNDIDLESTSSHALYSELDLSIDVTEGIKLIHSESISNNGFVIKFVDSLEFETTSSMKLQYFSRDTNTIYRPYLEFKWDDSSYITGSVNLLNTDQATISVKNNKGRYKADTKQRFRLAVRPKYPTRTFTTSSIYNINHRLPENSYYAIKDDFTGEYVVNYDINFTKISCDASGSYFDIYLNTFQPERYYKVVVKSTLDGSELEFDNENIFKVIK